MYYLGKVTSNNPKRKERKTGGEKKRGKKRKKKKRKEERRNKRQGVVTSSSDGVNEWASPCWQIIVARFRSVHWQGSCARCSSWNSTVTYTIINIVVLVDWSGGGWGGNKMRTFSPFARETRGKEILMIFWRRTEARVFRTKEFNWEHSQHKWELLEPKK